VHGQSVRGRLDALGLRPRKRLSQSFLTDERIAAAIVRDARLHHTDAVLEVGPGLGVLTGRLVAAAARVVAVEIDPALAQALRTTVIDASLTVQTADILRVDPATLFDEPYVVVANLPYHITSPVLRHLLAAGPPPAQRLILMVQREVAERITAAPPHLSALAVSLQVQARVRLVRLVPASAFHPVPRVGSAVLRVEPLADDARAIARDEVPAFTAFVQAGFKQPRKTLLNSLADGLGEPRAETAARLAALDLDPRRRPQELSVAEWVRLFRAN
jgi:16S rRNA (adenine1518-N6/adenine1519-N6)-dimethyltransferase